MGWKVIERRLGKAGPLKRRLTRQREWDRVYGESQWEVGYIVDGQLVTQEEAIDSIYNRSYEQHFEKHPEDLEEIVTRAKMLRNPHSEATTSVDLQVPAIMEYLKRNGLRLQGREVVDIGSWNGEASHSISIRLSPLQIKVLDNPKMTLEQFWQEKKCLAVWEDG